MDHPSLPRLTRLHAASLAVAGLALLPGAASACASCGCTLNSDFDSQGMSSHTGLSLDIRFDYLDQNQLRSGTGKISPEQVAANGWEVEQYTKNQYLTFGLEYAPSPDWGLGVQAPYIDRKHATLGNSVDGVTPLPDAAYTSHTDSLGDLRVLGRYQGFTPSRNVGVQFGLKLPTGAYDKNGTYTNPTGAVGGQASIDPGLQPGTGTTDLILGAYLHDALNRDWDYFGHVVGQGALTHRGPDGATYRPGNSVNLTAGLRYAALQGVSPQIQLNVRRVNSDEGDVSDRISTGGTLVHLTPGAIITVTHAASVYGFLQIPIYQKLNGAQLAVKYMVSVGTRYSF